MNRPWIPIAVVLVALLGSTLVVGSLLRSRLAEAEAVLDPFMVADVAELGSDDGLPAPVCGEDAPVAEALVAFHEAVEVDRLKAIEDNVSAPELLFTNPTFDSFLLESAIARLTSGPHQVLLRARSSDAGWCLADAEFSTEE